MRQGKAKIVAEHTPQHAAGKAGDNNILVLRAFATRGTNGGEKITAAEVIRKLSASTLKILARIMCRKREPK